MPKLKSHITIPNFLTWSYINKFKQKQIQIKI